MATLELVVIEFMILAVACFFLIRYYKGNMVTLDVAVAVYLSWVLGFAGILLLPYDISVAVVDEKQINSLYVVWNFIYWSTFVLAWIVLPMQMEYHNSGHFTFTEKMRDALMKNVWMGVLAGVAGVIYVVYMMATSKGSLSQVIGFVKAMGNTYGILLITVLMGNGLVGLPKRMWYYADKERELNGLYMMASSIETCYQEARYELEDCEWDVAKVAEKIRKSPAGSGIDPSVQAVQYVKVLQQSVADFAFSGRCVTKNYVTHTVGNETVSDSKACLVELHARLKQSHIRARACERRWKHLVKQCEVAEIAVNDENSSREEEIQTWCLMHTQGLVPGERSANSMLKTNMASCFQVIINTFFKICTAKYLKILSRIFSVVCGLVSLTILWSELFMAAQWRSPVGYVMGAYSPRTDLDSVIMQAVSFSALSYMSICTYWSLSRLNLGWAFSLQGPQLSPPASLIFNGEYFSRLQFALGYNFLMFLNVPGTKRTSFDQLMSNMTMVPVFGTSFTVYIPIVMILVSLMTILNVNARVLRLMGVESDDIHIQSDSCVSTCCRTRTKVALNDEDLERYEMGKKLVASELRAEAQAGTRTSTHASTKSSASHSRSGSGSRGAIALGVRSAYSDSADNTWLTSDGKDEAPYRDEEADDDDDSGSAGVGMSRGIGMGMDRGDKSFLGYATDGAREGHHKKTSSINNIANQIQSATSTSLGGEKYSSIDGCVRLKEPTQHKGRPSAAEALDGSVWSAKGIASKISEVFTSTSTPERPLLRTTPPLSIGNSRDEMEASSHHLEAFDKGLRGLSSSEARYTNIRSTATSSKLSGENFQMDRSEKHRNSSSSSYYKNNSVFAHSDTKAKVSLNSADVSYPLKRETPAHNDNFGLDDEPDEQYHGSRYANV